jgi:hypothetical protein
MRIFTDSRVFAIFIRVRFGIRFSRLFCKKLGFISKTGVLYKIVGKNECKNE